MAGCLDLLEWYSSFVLVEVIMRKNFDVFVSSKVAVLMSTSLWKAVKVERPLSLREFVVNLYLSLPSSIAFREFHSP